MMRIAIASLCLLAALCVAGQLETGMYDFTVDARKSGRAEPYHDALERILVATNGRVLITGQGDGGAPIRLSGVQTNGFISFKTLFPTGSVMQAMLMTNTFTGQVDTASSATGTITGTAGTNVYLTGTWSLRKKEEETSNKTNGR